MGATCANVGIHYVGLSNCEIPYASDIFTVCTAVNWGLDETGKTPLPGCGTISSYCDHGYFCHTTPGLAHILIYLYDV